MSQVCGACHHCLTPGDLHEWGWPSERPGAPRDGPEKLGVPTHRCLPHVRPTQGHAARARAWGHRDRSVRTHRLRAQRPVTAGVPNRRCVSRVSHVFPTCVRVCPLRALAGVPRVHRRGSQCGCPNWTVPDTRNALTEALHPPRNQCRSGPPEGCVGHGRRPHFLLTHSFIHNRRRARSGFLVSRALLFSLA